MVRERVKLATGCSGVDWFPIAILGGRAGGAASVSTLGVGAGLHSGDCGGTRGVGRWESTLGAPGGFYLEQVGCCLAEEAGRCRRCG